METKTALEALFAGMLSVVVSGCAEGPDARQTESIGAAQEADRSANALTANALTANALTANALTANALTANALTADALTSNALTSAALEDPLARQVLRYIASCALPAGAHFDIDVDGTVYGYDGELGLAPSWGDKDGHCDGDCQTWVSGCVLSRLDYLGVHVDISVRGEKLKSSHAEIGDYSFVDGTYYGDIFSTPQIRLACLPPGVTELWRVCGSTTDGCVVTVEGACQDTCDGRRADGSFPNCRNGLKGTHGVTPYKGSVTVFLVP